jgi:hypothetical protein
MERIKIYGGLQSRDFRPQSPKIGKLINLLPLKMPIIPLLQPIQALKVK